MKEIWKDIPGYEGLYIISNLGNIISLNFNHTGKPRNIKIMTYKIGYKFVNLLGANGRKRHFVHRLVAEAFIEKPNFDNIQVNHKDGNKGNNCVENLEWVTPSENIKHSFEHLGKVSPNKGRKGASHYASKAVYEYRLDGRFKNEWPSISDAARHYNCKPCQIINNIAGRTKTCQGAMWRYEKFDTISTEPVTGRKTHKHYFVNQDT